MHGLYKNEVQSLVKVPLCRGNMNYSCKLMRNWTPKIELHFQVSKLSVSQYLSQFDFSKYSEAYPQL